MQDKSCRVAFHLIEFLLLQLVNSAEIIIIFIIIV